MDWWYYVSLYFPLATIGAWRWSVWGLKQVLAMFYKPYQSNPGEYDTTLAIVTPVYNEDPQVFAQALKSWEANNPDEIIAVIDETDKACVKAFEDFSQDSARAKLIITPKPGKRPALADGIRAAKSEIVALVDSDTIWAPGIREQVLAPFGDPKIGGVGTRQNAIDSQSVWQKMTDILWDTRYHVETPSLSRWAHAVTCLSGRTAVYRREILLPLLDQMVNETFWGKRVISGEDKCLTRLVQKAGWHACYQGNARVFSSAPPDFATFWKQRVRWSRNTWRSDLRSLWEGWVWKYPYLAFYMLDRFVSPFTLFIGPVALGIAIALNQWIVVSILLLWFLVSRGVRIWFHLTRCPKDLLVLPVYIAVTY
jgi:hyaluronan synthase